MSPCMSGQAIVGMSCWVPPGPAVHVDASHTLQPGQAHPGLLVLSGVPADHRQLGQLCGLVASITARASVWAQQAEGNISV